MGCILGSKMMRQDSPDHVGCQPRSRKLCLTEQNSWQHPRTEGLYAYFHWILPSSLIRTSSRARASCPFTPSGELLKTLMSRPHSTPVKTESLTVGLGLDDFLKLPRWFQCAGVIEPLSQNLPSVPTSRHEEAATSLLLPLSVSVCVCSYIRMRKSTAWP